MFMGDFPELSTSEVGIFCGNSYLGIDFSTYVKMCANFPGAFIFHIWYSVVIYMYIYHLYWIIKVYTSDSIHFSVIKNNGCL